jgi:tetratricopeptide (TPR) repeat protein
LVGSLAYTFSDSFWWSAVEAEVYAMSSFFTAFVVWGILKWDVIEDDSKANRWLILIAYMMGLSIGVHMLNLVTIPALGLIYYFKKYKISPWGIVAALAISGGLVLFINDLIVPGLPTLAGDFEVFFVNTLGLPFGSGATVFGMIFVAALIYGIRYSHIKNKPVLNTFLLATAFILIGYCSYATVVIRSNFNTPINEDAPKDIMSFVRYLKREQYGSRPLLTGPYFTAKPIGIKYGAPVYTKGKDKYEITERKFTYEYEPGEETLLPRAWNSEHAETYRSIMGLAEGQKPTFFQDKFVYMFNQQIGQMYVRYFFWNFAGRESDEQGADWLGPRQWFEKVPAVIAQNKARNNFFMIPFLLGLIGMFCQFLKDTKNFAVVALLFIMLGLAIVVYLNSPPVEPRERDYIYSGSTYAFAFWIGLAVVGIAEFFQRFLRNQKTAALAATLIALTAPALMAWQGWDDHNRSNRFFSVDSGKNYLASCAPNAILFTGGDNDTFMLWYAQEVEGFRTDVRVVVLSYYNTDWYIEQTMHKTYLSEPFPYTLKLKDYQQGGPNDYLRYTDLKIKSIDLRQYLDLLSKNYAQLRYDDANIVPSRILTLDINKAEVIKKGIIPRGMDSLVVDRMQFKLTKGALEKKDLAFLDVLATNNWERPMYLNHTSLAQLNISVEDYAILEGNAYRILPIKKPNPDKDFVNTEVAYENMIHKFQYRGLDNDKLYYTEDYKGFVLNHRSSLNSLAESLIDQGDLKKAREVLLFSLEKMPDKGVPYDHTAVTMVDLLFKVGEKEKAVEISGIVGNRADEMAAYLLGKGDSGMELRRNIYILGNLYQILYKNGENDLGKKLEDGYNKHIEAMQIRRGGKRGDF